MGSDVPARRFTPTDVVDMSKEKDWASSLGKLMSCRTCKATHNGRIVSIGMMDWDTTRIVFTKRTLIEFLRYAMSLIHSSRCSTFAIRYTGTTVDTNFTNISKLPSACLTSTSLFAYVILVFP